MEKEIKSNAQVTSKFGNLQQDTHPTLKSSQGWMPEY